MRNFVVWCHTNNLQLNTSKTKELVIDFGRAKPSMRPVLIEGQEVEVVETNTSGWTTSWTGQATQGSCIRRPRAVLRRL